MPSTTTNIFRFTSIGICLSSYRDPYDLIYSFVSFLCFGLYLSQYTIAPIKSYVTNLTSSIYQNFISIVTLNSWRTSPVTTHFGLIAMTKDAEFFTRHMDYRQWMHYAHLLSEGALLRTCI